MKDKVPLISICIPTYNRSFYLNNLLNNIYIVSKYNYAHIEVCISDNHSTDQTQAVIDNWRNKLQIKDLIQKDNIGGNRNIIEVTRLASGRWILIIGDDDEIDPVHFISLLEYLQNLDNVNLVLVGVVNPENGNNLLGQIKSGIYSNIKFKIILLKTQLTRFGFIGMYIFNKELLPILYGLNVKEIHSWPHIGFFLIYLLKGLPVAVYDSCVVIQNALNSGYYWDIDDWVLVNLTKINVIINIPCFNKSSNLYCKALALLELYSLPNIKEILFWRIINKNSYNNLATNAFFLIYKSFGLAVILCLPHYMYLKILTVIPQRVINIILYIFKNREAVKKIYYSPVQKDKDKNCITRGPL